MVDNAHNDFAMTIIKDYHVISTAELLETMTATGV